MSLRAQFTKECAMELKISSNGSIHQRLVLINITESFISGVEEGTPHVNTEYSCICQGAGCGIKKKFQIRYSCYQTTCYQITFNQHYRILHQVRRVPRM
jgi:hypothetical protein